MFEEAPSSNVAVKARAFEALQADVDMLFRQAERLIQEHGDADVWRHHTFQQDCSA